MNIGANKNSNDRIADYVIGVRRMAPLASYLTVNISSPNTPGLRVLQTKALLRELVERVLSERGDNGPPVFLKVAPDLDREEIGNIAEIAVEFKLDALVISNTTVSRPRSLSSTDVPEGGLSGRPLRPIALKALKLFRQEVGLKLPLIGVGGIGSAEDAYERIRAGANIVQLYTAIAYNGPFVARRVNAGLLELMRRDGFTNISQAVGADVLLPSRVRERQAVVNA